MFQKKLMQTRLYQKQDDPGLSNSGRRLRILFSAVLLLSLAVPSLPLGADNPVLKTKMAKPRPSPVNPRKLLIVINSGKKKEVNGALNNAMNIQNFYGMDNIQLVIIAYGRGLRFFYKNSPVRKRIESMQQYNIEFLACGNTLSAQKRKPGDLLKGIAVAPAAIPEILERSLRGWLYFRP